MIAINQSSSDEITSFQIEYRFPNMAGGDSPKAYHQENKQNVFIWNKRQLTTFLLVQLLGSRKVVCGIFSFL
jgi:hypothetical protein